MTEKNLPHPSVLDLPRLGPQKWTYYQQGIVRLDDPRLESPDLTEQQKRMIHAFKTHERFVDAGAVEFALNSWEWPLSYLDFETINPAIPRYVGSAPFQHVPFQFSLHVEEKKGAPLVHSEYLHTEISDPRPALVEALVKSVPSHGSVVAYYHQFEALRLEELAALFPEHAEKLLNIRSRLVDPLPIFQQHVYDHEFYGSFSIKKVAPAIIGETLGYEKLEVGDGMAAQRAFEEIISPKTSPARKESVAQALLKYCEQDTMAMVRLVEWLRSVASS
jgi:hypothetical protein